MAAPPSGTWPTSVNACELQGPCYVLSGPSPTALGAYSVSASLSLHQTSVLHTGPPMPRIADKCLDATPYTFNQHWLFMQLNIAT